MGGDVSDYINPSTKIANSLSAGFSAITRNLASKTYLKGLSDFMEVITSDDPNKVERFANLKLVLLFQIFIQNLSMTHFIEIHKVSMMKSKEELVQQK